MSSKNAESPRSTNARRRSKRVWSITQRFAFLYVISTTGLLLMAGGYLYWTLGRGLAERDHLLLASKVRVLQLLLREQPGPTNLLVSEVEHEASESALRYFLRVLDEQGRTQAETPGMSASLPAERFAAPLIALPQSPRELRRHVRGFDSMLMLSVAAPVGPDGHHTWTVQAALDISTDLALLAEYRWRLLSVLAGGVVFAASVGVWLARKGAEPLIQITERARHITASQLDERIVVEGWPVELEEMAGAFNAMLDRLESAFAQLSRFSADLAHELRTPITNLRGEAEVALARNRDVAEYQQILASSLEEYDRLARMIDALLFLARAERPETVIERVRFDARQELESVRDFYDAMAAEQDVRVTCEGIAHIVGDPLLFRRAVSNLLANALRHSPAGGGIDLNLRMIEDGRAQLEVRDTGPGIAPEHLSRLFDRFYRVDGSRVRDTGGSGLGLSIVRSIMRLHSGTVEVMSELGRGTTFILRWPAPTPADPVIPRVTAKNQARNG